MLAEYARQTGVDLRFFATTGQRRPPAHERGPKKVYTLWDIYPYAALVTYPSLYEGFGNAFLESVYFKVPMLVNRYAIFHRDIEPKGFKVPDHGRIRDPGGRGRSPPHSGRRDVPEKDGRTQLPDRHPSFQLRGTATAPSHADRQHGKPVSFMNHYFSSQIMERLRGRLQKLYGDQADGCLERLAMMVGRYGVSPSERPSPVVVMGPEGCRTDHVRRHDPGAR